VALKAVEGGRKVWQGGSVKRNAVFNELCK